MDLDNKPRPHRTAIKASAPSRQTSIGHHQMLAAWERWNTSTSLSDREGGNYASPANGSLDHRLEPRTSNDVLNADVCYLLGSRGAVNDDCGADPSGDGGLSRGLADRKRPRVLLR